MNKKVLFLFGLLITTLIASSMYAAAFDFYGYTKYINKTAINGTNVTVALYNLSAQFNKIGEYSDLSNESGWFNVTNLPDPTAEVLYKVIVRHYTDNANPSTSRVDYIGPSLPEFPGFEIQSVAQSGVTFYLKPGATINISAQELNQTGSMVPVAFQYQIKDKKLGYPIATHFGSYVSSALIHVPRDRNYSIMIYPNASFPVSHDVNSTGLSDGYYEKVFNTTESLQRLTGNVGASGVSSFDSLRVVSLLLEPGRMVYFGSSAPIMFNFTGDDTFNLTSGFYNISLVGPDEGAELIIFAIAKSGTTYYGGFDTVTTTYSGVTPSTLNITLYKLAGSEANITTFNNANISLAEVTFNLLNSTGGAISDFAFVEVQVNYEDYNLTNFTWMLDVDQSAGGVFKLPLLNISGVERMNVFTQRASPRKISFTAAQVNTGELNVTLKDAFNMEDPDEGASVLGNLFIDMVVNSSTCNVPNYASTCSLFGGEQATENMNPLAVVMSGAAISFVMKNSAGITVHYVNVDLLASGPPDALFDSDSSDTTSASTFEQAWKFGSTGPEIYDYVILGIPYTEGSSSQTGLNESADINVTIPYLYDDNWNVIWNSSVNPWEHINSSNSTLKDYADYFDLGYAAYLNGTGVICNASDENLTSGLCYKDTANNMIWIKIPHFSGVAPKISGSVITASSGGTTGGGTTGGATSGAGAEETTTGTVSHTFSKVNANEETLMDISNTLIHLTQIKFTLNEDVTNLKLTVSSLDSKPSNVEELSNTKVYQYLKIDTVNLDESQISSAEIRFEVKKSWLESNELTKDQVALFRYAEDNWEELPTSFIEETDDAYIFKASTTGFSYFAIGAKLAEEEAPVEVEEEVKEQPEKEKFELNWKYAAILVSLLIVLALLYFYREKIGKLPSIFTPTHKGGAHKGGVRESLAKYGFKIKRS